LLTDFFGCAENKNLPRRRLLGAEFCDHFAIVVDQILADQLKSIVFKSILMHDGTDVVVTVIEQVYGRNRDHISCDCGHFADVFEGLSNIETVLQATAVNDQIKSPAQILRQWFIEIQYLFHAAMLSYIKEDRKSVV
jgi:hypothetical protein